MNPEKIFSMVTEKSIAVNDIPGGGFPDFTTEDARHALAHMSECEFNYCQYVFLLYDDKLKALTENATFHILKRYPDLNTTDLDEGLLFVMDLCEMACKEERKPAGKIPDTKRYDYLDISRHKWRYKWKDVFYEVRSYLTELRSNVERHIFYITKNTD
jgi:hypothetical protein